MLDITQKTIGDVFSSAVAIWPDAVLFISPKTISSKKSELTYANAQKRIMFYQARFQDAGYGYGERIALLLGNRVEHYLIKLAANNLGISVVPLNPDLSAFELIYILKDSNSILIITIPSGTTTHYADIAKKIGNPQSIRAVASAIAKNPIAWLIPCHRVLRKSGDLGGYRWGENIKRRMLSSELLK